MSWTTQQTTTCDFTCSVSEFMSSTGSIHVCFCTWIHRTKNWCVNMCLLWNQQLFTWWRVPVKPYQFWPSTTRVKLVQNLWQQAEHVYSCEYTWKHVLVEQYQLCYAPVWYVPTGSEMVPCLLGMVLFEPVSQVWSYIWPGWLLLNNYDIYQHYLIIISPESYV